ncbi:MAG TPA: formylglycine-generating enzyme family protein, partial [Myxococcota bacterium]|nr:formylglycine-generating enzyme family protein [Myxococcota bacterium]
PCAAITCGDNGTCVVTADNEALCVCHKGHHRVGDTCVATTNVCAGVDCGEQGRCAVGAVGPICICNEGFTLQGDICQASPVDDPCEDVVCAGNGTCAIAHDNSAVCVCRPGYQSDGAQCVQDVAGDSPCDDIDCSNIGSCVVTPSNQALCVCDQGFHSVGQDCVPTDNACKNVDCGVGRCALGATGHICICDPGYTVQQGICKVAPANDPCDGVECAGNGACVIAHNNTPVCLCRPGYHSDGDRCLPDAAPGSPCANITCSRKGSCVVTPSDQPLCVCDQGYHREGNQCVATPNPCATVNCGVGGRCALGATGTICICDEGYTVQNGVCQESPASNPCKDVVCAGNGVCAVAHDNTAVCLCRPGYLSDGAQCVPAQGAASACANVTCSYNGSCVVTSENQPLCICDQGYHLEGDNQCVATTNPCIPNNCGENAYCVVSSENQPLCMCDLWSVFDGSGCVDSPCLGVYCGTGSCVVTASTEPLCVCDHDYQLVGDTCQANPCSGVTCSNKGTCVLTASNQPLCICNQGYRRVGNTCQPNPCMGVNCGGNGSCVVSASNQAVCVCNEGYQLVSGTCQPNPCTGVNCGGNGSCVVTGSNQPLCVCNEGYYTDGTNCVEVAQCNNSSACSGDWCVIPACTFQMGSPGDEGCRLAIEGPVHPVTISRPFYMKRTEVTQGEWKAFTNTNPSFNKACGDSCPVERVNWYDAVRYANWLSAQQNLDSCYNIQSCTGTPGSGSYSCTVTFVGLGCSGYRLPTEAEWEYAARAGTVTAYWTGTNIGYMGLPVCNAENPIGIALPEVAWYGFNSDNKSHEVKQKPPNPWGLYDVYGNVYEWVHDWFGKGYYTTCEQGCTDPLGPTSGASRVHRGGAYHNGAGSLRSADRGYAMPSTGNSYLGFRLVRRLP